MHHYNCCCKGTGFSLPSLTFLDITQTSESAEPDIKWTSSSLVQSLRCLFLAHLFRSVHCPQNSQRARRYWHRYWHCMECSGFFWDYSFLLTCVLLSTLLFLQMPQNTYIHQAKTVITDEFFVPLRHALSRCHPSPTVGENGSDRQFFGCVLHVWKGRKCGEQGLDIVRSSYEKTMLYISCIQWFCHPVAQCSFVNAKHIAGTIFNLHLRLVNVVTVTEKMWIFHLKCALEQHWNPKKISTE